MSIERDWLRQLHIEPMFSDVFGHILKHGLNHALYQYNN